jgi:hypothetical protein
MKTIIINENIEKKLFEMLISEGFGYNRKVAIIKKYLDTHFIKATFNERNKEGDFDEKPLVIMLDTKNKASNVTLTLEQLYYKLQYKYQNIITNKVERNKFIWNTVHDWYYNKITKNNNLSKY